MNGLYDNLSVQDRDKLEKYVTDFPTCLKRHNRTIMLMSLSKFARTSRLPENMEVH